MAGRSPKRKDTTPRKSMNVQKNVKTDSDFRLVIVLGAALILAITIIVVILLTTK
jgi:hypothetical protein